MEDNNRADSRSLRFCLRRELEELNLKDVHIIGGVAALSGLVHHRCGEIAMHPWMVTAKAIQEVLYFLDQFFLYHGWIQLRVSYYHGLQKGYLMMVE